MRSVSPAAHGGRQSEHNRASINSCAEPLISPRAQRTRARTWTWTWTTRAARPKSIRACLNSVHPAPEHQTELNGTSWLQPITNRSNGKTVSFAHDLKGQKQQWLLHQIELKGQTKPVADVIFTNIVAKMSDSQPMSCAPSETGMNDWYAPARASADGKTCCIAKIILRASGIMPSSPNEP